MNEIVKVFESEEFGSVRTVLIDGEMWFVGKDVAEILGYSNVNKAIQMHVDEEDKKVLDFKGFSHFGNTLWGENDFSNKIVINESGLYSLIISSKLPKAKGFKRWVTSTILPTVRKTGGYVANEDLFINTYLPNVDENVKALFKLNLQAINQLNQTIDTQMATIKTQQKKIEEDKPKVEFADHVADTSDCIDIGTLSKIAKKENIHIGRNRLFEWLRKKDFLMSKGKHKNEPYQRYIDNGWFVVREYIYNTAYGEQIGAKTYVTGKGQMCIIERLRKDYVNNELI